jgi:membrane protease YdiL (CAAX protease family)
VPTRQPKARLAASSHRAITACFVTTLLVVLGAYLLPRDWSATGVAAIFLGTTYVLALSGRSTDQIRHYGLSLGGLLETEPLSSRRLFRDGATAFAYAFGTGLIVFPCFAFGFWYWWQPTTEFVFAPLSTVTNDVLGQLLVVALPEEAFYRGYLQTSLDDVWKKRWRLFGGYLSPGLLVSSSLFAFGHLLTEPNPSRLAVFFPSLLFGWLRTRTSSIGASIVFHALCNLFSSYLGRSFGLWS